MSHPRYTVLASDYDGTLAHDGVVDTATVDALRHVKQRGVRLVMVTGRVLPELVAIFPDVDVFDLVVAENGATLYDPASGIERMLAEPVAPALVRMLTDRGVPVSVGRSVAATTAEHERAFAAAIELLG